MASKPLMVSNVIDFNSEENGDFSYMPRMPRGTDEWLGWGINLGFLVLIGKSCAYWLQRLIYAPLVSGDTSQINAFAVARLANDLTQNTLYFLVIALWHTFCYTARHNDGIYRFWKMRLWGQLLMPGGFAPRPAAMSMGFLLFVSQTIVQEQVLTGTELRTRWGDWDACRAVDLELSQPRKFWFPRLHRMGPVTWGGWAFRCFGVETLGMNGWLSTTFEFQEDTVFNFTDGLGPQSWSNASDYEHPYSDDTILPSDKVYIHTDGRGHLMSRDCMYQCVSWRSVGVNDLIKNLGMIITGAAIVVKITETLSNSVGTQFIGPDTEAEVFHKLVRKATSQWRFLGCLRYKKSVCALQLAVLCFGPIILAARLDIDGYYTVDYYVMCVLLCSVEVAVMVRSWLPFSFGNVLYTKDLWQHGEDYFLKIAPPNRPEKVKIDLYQWIHLTNTARFNHLHLYCRQAVMSEVDAELIRQHERFGDSPSPLDLMDDDECMRVLTINAIEHPRYQSVKKGYLKKETLTVEGGTRGVIVGKSIEKGFVDVAWELVFVTVTEAGRLVTREAKGEMMETTPARLVDLLEATSEWSNTIDLLQQEDVDIRHVRDLIADSGQAVV